MNDERYMEWKLRPESWERKTRASAHPKVPCTHGRKEWSWGVLPPKVRRERACPDWTLDTGHWTSTQGTMLTAVEALGARR